MGPLVQALLATFLVSLIALLGIGIAFSSGRSPRRETVLVSFAAGVLLATAFLDLLPEAVRHSGTDGSVFVASLASMIAFFFLERLLQGFHVHEADHAAVSGPLVLIGDAVHNFVDGVAIAASFLADLRLGMATTLAVAVHEIPQEIADAALLLRSRFSRRSALAWNFACGLCSVVGAGAVFALRGPVEHHLAWFMTSTAGMFLYIAASDLIPELHHPKGGVSWIYTLPFLAGVALIALLGRLVRGE
jgi:zinc and cadmium transporter